MKRSLRLIVTIAALGLAGSAYAFEPGEQTGAAQPLPGAQTSTLPSMEDPSTMSQPSDPSRQQSEPSTAQSSASSASENSRLAAIVPAGMSSTEACAGFRSTHECAATLHASQNLGLPFTDLKAKVTGGQKLGAAIKELKPDANVKAEVRKAEEQARADVTSPQG